jgi:hypothetical protein
LHVVAQPAQVSPAEPWNAVLHQPLLTEIGDPGIGAETLSEHNGKIDIVNIGNTRWLTDLGGDSPCHSRRSFDDHVFFNCHL